MIKNKTNAALGMTSLIQITNLTHQNIIQKLTIKAKEHLLPPVGRKGGDFLLKAILLETEWLKQSAMFAHHNAKTLVKPKTNILE